MSDIKFRCLHCAQPLEAPVEMGGEAVDCPSCKGRITIPRPETATMPVRESPALPVQSPPPDEDAFNYIDRKRQAMIPEEKAETDPQKSGEVRSADDVRVGRIVGFKGVREESCLSVPGVALDTVMVHPDGERIFTGGNDGAIRVWRFRTKELIAEFDMHVCAAVAGPPGKHARLLAISPDGRLLAWHTYLGPEVQLCESATGRPVRTLMSSVPINDGKGRVFCHFKRGKGVGLHQLS
jgi:DNA-directed RNA polymerase subunit RPC12/RpoP